MTKNFYTIFNIVIITGIIYAAVDCFYLFVEARFDQPDFIFRIMETKQKTTALPKQSSSDFRIISTRNVFGETPQKDNIPEDMPELENLEPTSLKISLMGTVFGDRMNAAAVIHDKVKKTQDLYRVGDSIQNAIIKNILRGKIVLSYNGRDEILVMDDTDSENTAGATAERTTATQGRTVAPYQRTITVRRDDILKSLEDINDVMNQANISPYLTDGKADGMSISGIKASSVYRKMGFRNGDIIKRIEGSEIKGPEDLISLYNSLKSEDSISMDIIRRGREMSLNYRLR